MSRWGLKGFYLPSQLDAAYPTGRLRVRQGWWSRRPIVQMEICHPMPLGRFSPPDADPWHTGKSYHWRDASMADLIDAGGEMLIVDVAAGDLLRRYRG